MSAPVALIPLQTQQAIDEQACEDVGDKHAADDVRHIHAPDSMPGTLKTATGTKQTPGKPGDQMTTGSSTNPSLSANPADEALSLASAVRKPPKMEVELREDGRLHVEVSRDFNRISQAAGNQGVSNALLGQISLMGSRGKNIDNDTSNFALGFVDAMKPQDATEALLLTQMAAIHQATMVMAKRMNHVDNLPQQDSAERALNKLARTYAAQVEALKRYRSKGQQVVRVERVTVESGAQAVVGNVNHGGGRDGES